jgi:DNA-binding NarL/FixJ family response regulator
MKPIKIALCDDQELFIESLSALFSNLESEVQVIWCARNGEETLEKVLADRPDVLLLDYFFKGRTLDGGETCRLLLEKDPSLGVLMLSVSCEITVIRQALQNGARGYASKDIGKAELLYGIKTVAQGAYFLDQTALLEVKGFLCSSHQHIGSKSSAGKSPITPREMEVAPLYVKGKSVKEIAETLFISEDTVESHIKNIRSKTGAASRYEVGEWLKKNELWEG